MSVRKRGNKFGIDFRCSLPDGRRIRCFETVDVPQDPKAAKRMDTAVDHHQGSGTFNYLDFFPNGSKARYFRKISSGITYEDFVSDWHEKRSIGTQTAYNQWVQYKATIFPHIGHTPVVEITQDDILVFRKTLESSGLSSSTINTFMKYLCHPLKDAHRRGLIGFYPCDGIKKLRENRPDVSTLNFDELRHLLQVTAK